MKPPIEYRPKKPRVTHIKVFRPYRQTKELLQATAAKPTAASKRLMGGPLRAQPGQLTTFGEDDPATLLERRRAHDRARAKAYRAKQKAEKAP